MGGPARQPAALVSSGRRRLKVIILVVTGILVALLLGAFIYLLYSNIQGKDSACHGEQAMMIQTTPSQTTLSPSGRSPMMTSASPMKTVTTTLASTSLFSKSSISTSIGSSTKSISLSTESNSTESSQSTTISTSPSTGSTSESISSSTVSTMKSMTTSIPGIPTEPTSPGISATSCETNITGTPLHCSEVGSCGGVFYVFPYGEEGSSVPVYCSCEGEGEVWTVIQKRFDGTVDFNRSWTDYKNGFGDACGEYWLGNEALHQLTATNSFRLMIVVIDWGQNSKFATYDTFSVADEANGYRLNLGQYYGNAGDSMDGHNNCEFNTKDRDNDENPLYNQAERYSGAWWYCDGLQSNLNGLYYPSSINPDLDGILWTTGHGNDSLQETRMMIHPQPAE